MNVARRSVLAGFAAALALPRGALAAEGAGAAGAVHDWFRLILELVRHTPTLTPPVSSRAFAYLGVALWEALQSPGTRSMAGQLTALTPPPARPAGTDDAVVADAVLGAMVAALFQNTGPTGQRAMAAMTRKLGERTATGLSPAVVEASAAHGRAVATHILSWSQDDGGSVIVNMGFPETYAPAELPEDWVPTSLVRQQQTPLLPDWGRNRPFAMASGDLCGLAPPPAYSEDPGSAFHAEAMEVYEVSRSLTEEQKLIARFWSDDPMLTPTPPGHWMFIAMSVLEAEGAAVARRAEVLMLLGVAMADAFIACWRDKYAYNLLRPVTYIRRHIDKAWEPLLITPPFPEYPSGHSTQSGAAQAVLTHLYGEDFAFADTTHEDEGMGARSFPSFRAAAEEAGISRLYGGIHFRSAIDQGLAQGICVATSTLRLELRA
jgi:PAP2 superfamily